MSTPVIFICYSHIDTKWKDTLVAHLRVLERESVLNIWEDGRLAVGTEWKQELETAISRARVAILVVSVDFLNSDFIRREELPELLKRRRAAGLHVIPLIARDCGWREIPSLSQLQVRPIHGKALAVHERSQRDTLLTALAAEVKRLIEGAEAKPEATLPFSHDQEARAPKSLSGPTRIAPLESNVDTLLEGTSRIASLEGLLLNSGRFLEQYLLARHRGLRIGSVRFIVPSSAAIRLAYRNMPRAQERYLAETVQHINRAWEDLEREGAVNQVEFRSVDVLPLNLCVIKDGISVMTGLYEPDPAHPLGLTCQKSWLHEPVGHSCELSRCYVGWFRSLWQRASVTQVSDTQSGAR